MTPEVYGLYINNYREGPFPDSRFKLSEVLNKVNFIRKGAKDIEKGLVQNWFPSLLC